MWELFVKYRLYIIYGLAIFVAFLFYSLNIKEKEHANLFERGVIALFSPVNRVVTLATRPISDVWSDYLNLVDVREENKHLRESVKELNTREISNRELLAATERLKSLLNLKTQLKLPSVAATVIGEDSSPWFNTIVIDRGEKDGLAEGMPVVATDGIVGQVVKVAAESARVLLITDHASAVAAVIQRSRARGVVRGKGRDLCALEFSLSNEDVTVGDIVVSSGIGGIFPKGLPLGEVTMVKKGTYGIFQTIEVKPTVNVSRLEEVLVLLKKIQ